MSDPGRGVTLSDTNSTFCCVADGCSPDPKVSTLRQGIPLTTISIIESSGHAFQLSGTSASSTSSQVTAGGTPFTSHAITTGLQGAETTSLLSSLASSNPSQQTSKTNSASSLTSSTNQSQTPPTAHSSREAVKLALSISIPIILLLAMLATVVLWLKRRNKRKQGGKLALGELSRSSHPSDEGPLSIPFQDMHNTAELGELGRYSQIGELTAETRTSRQELPASKPDDSNRATGFNTGPWRWLERGFEHR